MAIPIRRYSPYSSLDLLHSSSFQYPLSFRTLSVCYSLLLLLVHSHSLSNFIVTVRVFCSVFFSRYEQFKHQGKLLEGDDLDFAFDSISAFSDTTDNQEALFGPHEPLSLKDIKLVCYSFNFIIVRFDYYSIWLSFNFLLVLTRVLRNRNRNRKCFRKVNMPNVKSEE